MSGPYVLIRDGKRSKPFTFETLEKLVDRGQCKLDDTLRNADGEMVLVRDVLQVADEPEEEAIVFDAPVAAVPKVMSPVAAVPKAQRSPWSIGWNFAFWLWVIAASWILFVSLYPELTHSADMSRLTSQLAELEAAFEKRAASEKAEADSEMAAMRAESEKRQAPTDAESKKWADKLTELRKEFEEESL